jgi:hypothetical protein
VLERLSPFEEKHLGLVDVSDPVGHSLIQKDAGQDRVGRQQLSSTPNRDLSVRMIAD